jgi:hypothetical protein
MDAGSARRAPTGISGVGEKNHNRATRRCRDMCGAGIVPDGEIGCVGKIDQAGKPGTADEIDRSGASRTDFGRKWLFACPADNNRPRPDCLEQALSEFAVASRRPALGSVAR